MTCERSLKDYSRVSGLFHRIRRRLVWFGVIVTATVSAAVQCAFAQRPDPRNVDPRNVDPGYIDAFVGKPRVVVLTDVGNEPDDQMSFVRLLLYSNELDLEALVATTSTWQKNATHPETLHKRIAAYGEVRANLLKHASDWPSPPKLDVIVSSGPPAYGMAAVSPDKLSAGAESIIRAADRTDPRPVWITIWGGANTLAEALSHVRA